MVVHVTLTNSIECVIKLFLVLLFKWTTLIISSTNDVASSLDVMLLFDLFKVLSKESEFEKHISSTNIWMATHKWNLHSQQIMNTGHIKVINFLVYH